MKFVEIMLDMLTSAYTRVDLQNSRKQKPPETNIGRLFSTFGWGLDIIRDNLERVRLWDDVDKAQGAVLDRYGRNFGVKRDGAEDDFYRLMIKVKMISLLSGGDINTVIESAASLFDVEPATIDLYEVFPAKIWLYINEDEFDEEHARIAPLIAQMVKRIMAAGVGKRIFFKTRSEFRAELLAAGAMNTVFQAKIEPESATGIHSRERLFSVVCVVDHAGAAVFSALRPRRRARGQAALGEAAMNIATSAISPGTAFGGEAYIGESTAGAVLEISHHTIQAKKEE